MTLGQGTESSLIVDIVFWVIAVSSIVAALAVVQVRDLFRSAVFLMVSFVGVAGMFVLLRAEFLAIVQVLLYAGGIGIASGVVLKILGWVTAGIVARSCPRCRRPVARGHIYCDDHRVAAINEQRDRERRRGE